MPTTPRGRPAASASGWRCAPPSAPTPRPACARPTSSTSATRSFAVRVADGRCTTSEGQPGAADVVLTMEVSTLGALLHQELSPEEALGSGRATVAGKAAALQRLVQLFALPSRAQATTA
jgi:putative sterol carrier protein